MLQASRNIAQDPYDSTRTSRIRVGSFVVIQNLHHVSIAVRDLQKAKPFYAEVLPFQEIERPPFDSNVAWFSIGDQQLHLIECPDGEILRTGPIHTGDEHLAIWVTSYHDTIVWLEQAGVP
ncbi:VOC family protein [Paenibacillus terrigena]|uniref:VOC family protein n=1 Tax=Paenibacillus terrigena TaxID=369333 RepID=UPI00037C4009